MTQLVKYNEACRALAAAKQADEVKDIRDRAEAMRAYAKQAQNRQMEIDAAEIRIRAERRLGELIVLQKETVGLNTGAAGIGTSAVPKENRTPTLADVGVSKKLSSHVQKVAAIPENKFEEIMGDWRESLEEANARVTTNILDAYSDVKREERQRERESYIAESVKENVASAELADAIEWLKGQKPADMLLTDPPYMTDVEDIDAFAASWLPLALSKVKPTGRAYVCIGAYPEEINAYCNVAMPDQILVWTYRNTIGPSPRDGYKQNWQAILYYKGAEAEPLDCQSLVEQFSVQDINAPDGRQGDRYHAWQKPLDLGDRFVRHATKPGDVVIDPFCCTGTFLISAARLGRSAYGCDLSSENLAIAEQRGCQIINRI